MLDRTVRFAVTVDAVLEDYNSYLEQVIVKNRGGGGAAPPPPPTLKTGGLSSLKLCIIYDTL